MPYSAIGKNLMLNALKGTNPTTPITHVGLATKGPNITGVTSTGSPDTFTKTSHGLANGDRVVLSGLTGGTGAQVGQPYFVINTATNTFQLSSTVGGSAVDFGTDITAATVNKVTELSGGSPAYARVAIAFNAAADGTMDDSTNGAVINVPAAAVVDYVEFWSASTAGSELGIIPVTQETYAGQGTYTVTDADLDLNA